MPLRPPADGYAFPVDMLSPPVLGLGDSLYNGMRSASVTREFAERSVPALVSRAIAPAYAFRVPAYPEPLLLDVEETARSLGVGDLAGGLGKRLREAAANGRRWLDGKHRVRAKHACWDNLAQAGAELPDVIATDVATWRARAEALRPALKGLSSLADLGRLDVLGLHMALNALFLFNPNARPELDGLRPIDIAAARRPQRLLVSLGANHGLIDITLRGDVDGGLRRLSAFADDVAELAGLVADFGPETRRVVFSTLPLPSTVPNLAPPYDPGRETGVPPEGARYYPEYHMRLGAPGDWRVIGAAEMAELDGDVGAINERMATTIKGVFARAGQDGRARVFRLDRAMMRFDGKHDRARMITRDTAGAALEAPERRYSNRPIEFIAAFGFRGFRHGGLGSLDNHHPTGLGYSVYARALLDMMALEDPTIDPARRPISELGDRLFSDPPWPYELLVSILYDLRRRRAAARIQEGPPAPIETTKRERAVEDFGGVLRALAGGR